MKRDKRLERAGQIISRITSPKTGTYPRDKQRRMLTDQTRTPYGVEIILAGGRGSLFEPAGSILAATRLMRRELLEHIGATGRVFQWVKRTTGAHPRPWEEGRTLVRGHSRIRVQVVEKVSGMPQWYPVDRAYTERHADAYDMARRMMNTTRGAILDDALRQLPPEPKRGTAQAKKRT